MSQARANDLTRGAAASLAAGALLFAAACASSGGGSSAGSLAAARLDEGAVALSSGEFAAARERLIEARAACGDLLVGRQALLLLGALELDPRNPDRSPARAAELVAAHLRLPETFPWTRPLAESLYLLAREMGGPEPADGQGPPHATATAAACDRADHRTVATAAVLPDFTTPTVPARLRALERKREELRRELAQLQGELDRVRATLRP